MVAPCQHLFSSSHGLAVTNLDNLQGLVDGSLGVERETGVDLGRNLAGNYLQDLTAELDEESVKSIVDLLVQAATLLLGEVDGGIDQLGVLGLLGSSENEGGVGSGILGLVLSDACEDVSRYPGGPGIRCVNII